ncbi:hypothetical protein [Neisseria zalophi]|uniref:Uncharacterized protein n=1 Tax=Neisseria zalophi TaxID=640030 RepID=A0A5J6PU48_9NEIS|nr:hypothetical protein [Neisseria zalophi]QEY26221.1 hypothetical protein D0T92_06580 [Neisseria zalophi]
MKPATLPTPPKTEPLQTIHIIADSNIHRPDLCAPGVPQTQGIQISESLLPQIRTVATLIAAMRHDFSVRSPEVFTEEADWFAARIIVLGVRRFHLDITLLPMLQTANRRARTFAASRQLAFTPAEMRMSLHAGRPANLLIAETILPVQNSGGIINNSRALQTLIASQK